MKHKKQILSAVLASSMLLSLAGCGSASDSSETVEARSKDDMITITFYNSKKEISDLLDAAADEYAEEFGVNIEFSFPSDDIANYVEATYASGHPYTMVMVEANDIEQLGSEYGFDLSGQDWVDETDYAYYSDEKVVGFPFCIEAFGIIYNSDAIEAVTGEKFDPDSIMYLSEFTEFLNTLVAGGMESPTVIQKAYWSLSHHYLQQVYDEQSDPASLISRLYAGEVDIMTNKKFNSLMNTFDVLMEYNYFKEENPAKASDEQVYRTIANGEVAFKFGGSWEWDEYVAYDASENIGIMPLPQDIEDNFTGMLDGGVTKYVFIDNSEYTTDEQREAAMDFLNWLVYSDDGQTLVSETCGMVSPFRNNTVPCSNPLNSIVKDYADEGKVIQTYANMPFDYQSILGERMQDYLAGTITRNELGMYIEEYWVSATPPSAE